jgi:hypothetical protein
MGASYHARMAETLAHLALVIAAAFTGAAVYVNFVEHPARRLLDPSAALAEWQPAYRRGAAMQSSMATVGFMLAAAAGFLGAGPFVIAGAVLMIAPWPWTYLAIMKLNTRMLSMVPSDAPANMHAMLDRWNALHGVRTALGAGATLCLLWATLNF